MAAEIVTTVLAVTYKVIESIYNIIAREQKRCEDCVRLKRKVEFIETLLNSHSDIFRSESSSSASASSAGQRVSKKSRGRKHKDPSMKKALKNVLSALRECESFLRYTCTDNPGCCLRLKVALGTTSKRFEHHFSMLDDATSYLELAISLRAASSLSEIKSELESQNSEVKGLTSSVENLSKEVGDLHGQQCKNVTEEKL
ncbi:PREDICTED: uncharacterized protein LOC106811420 [Priapulus caudatus]|uniref:Uncharacterized protein LOC106811420 n=1 Tax=Priapulus caudatus TaxID=37621 RepID=A0ABM1EE89_PRICU|nr:PREDICTED: uncharacterized protein LOC106811420 [Priapulus caudatus]